MFKNGIIVFFLGSSFDFFELRSDFLATFGLTDRMQNTKVAGLTKWLDRFLWFSGGLGGFYQNFFF